MATPSLADALAEANEVGIDHRTIERLLTELDDDEAAALTVALTSSMPAARIEKAFKKAGHNIGRGAVYGWRARNAAR